MKSTLLLAASRLPCRATKRLRTSSREIWAGEVVRGAGKAACQGGSLAAAVWLIDAFSLNSLCSVVLSASNLLSVYLFLCFWEGFY